MFLLPHVLMREPLAATRGLPGEGSSCRRRRLGKQRSRRHSLRGRCAQNDGPKLSLCSFFPVANRGDFSPGRGGLDQMAEGAALMVALARRLTEPGVVVA